MSGDLTGPEMFSVIQKVLLRHLAADNKVEEIKRVAELEFYSYEDKLLTIRMPPGKTNANNKLIRWLEEIVEDNEFPIERFAFATNPPKQTADAATAHEISLTPYSEIPPEHLDWLWKNYLARKRVHHWAGNSIQGKSPVAIDLIACITSPVNRPQWPDGTPNRRDPQAVLLLAGEDDPADTVRPRLKVAKANERLVYDVKMTVNVKGKPIDKLLALDRDISSLIEKARTIKNLGAIFIDPITNYLGKVSMNKEEQVRDLLMPLVELSKTARIAVVTIGHFNRREVGTDPLQRVMGAAAFHGVARFLYLFGPDPEDADQYAHVMVQRRGVGAPGLRYKTQAQSCKWEGESSKVIRVLWRGETKATAEAIVDPPSSEQKTQVAEAADCLRQYLREGHKPQKKCIAHVKEQTGIDLIALNTTRVRTVTGVSSSKRKGDDFYSWELIKPDA